MQSSKYLRFVSAINLVAGEADEQLKVLPNGVCKPDEIAILFDECKSYLDDLVKEGSLSRSIEKVLIEIDSEFDEMSSGHKYLWTEEAVRVNHNWAQQRQRARELLEMMGEEKRLPVLDWVTFIQG